MNIIRTKQYFGSKITLDDEKFKLVQPIYRNIFQWQCTYGKKNKEDTRL